MRRAITRICLNFAAALKTGVRASDFDFDLPPERIAQFPAPARDASRLLALRRADAAVTHHHFRDLKNFLRAGDVLVVNNSRVIPARLRGVNAQTGGEFEVLLLEENALNDWWAMLRPGKRAALETRIHLCQRDGRRGGISAVVTEINAEGHRRLQFTGVTDLRAHLDTLGDLPLPPYIQRDTGARAEDWERYQTIYAQPAGSVAAPTAGLHFTNALLEEIRALGVVRCEVTLHVGLGTFAPVKTESLASHIMHEEQFELGEAAAQIINTAKASGRRVIAVGTTTMRVLESVAAPNAGRLVPGAGRTRIFIHPPFHFRIVDALLTNFHLPRSTLLMLVSAFAAPGETRGREMILSAYAQAIRENYRFFSYGDAMLLS